MSTPNTSPVDAAISAIGGISVVVRAMNLKGHATVQQWRRNGIPAKYCPTIERLTNGKVRCEELQPAIEWHVLRTPQQVEA